MGKVKVLHIIGGGEFGGAEQHLLTLLNHMDRDEFEVHTACLFAEPLAPLVRKAGFPAYAYPMKNKFDFRPIGEIAALIGRERFDIIHTHGVRANFIGRLAAGKAGARHVVTTVHSVLAFDHARWLDRQVNALCEKATRKVTERFIAVSHTLAQQLQSEGIAADKILVIHNGLELSKYNPDLSGLPVRQELSIDPRSKVIGIVARLHPVKGHSFLFTAFSRACREVPNLVLLVVGSGFERERLEKLAENLGISKNVIFTGFRKDVPEVIAAIDILVLPSLSEGLSLTVMEGLAMKKPVLATAVGGTPEIITGGQNGLLVPPGDADALAEGIIKLLGNEKMAARMGEAGRKTVEEKFSAGQMAARTAALYREILEGGRS